MLLMGLLNLLTCLVTRYDHENLHEPIKWIIYHRQPLNPIPCPITTFQYESLWRHYTILWLFMLSKAMIGCKMDQLIPWDSPCPLWWPGPSRYLCWAYDAPASNASQRLKLLVGWLEDRTTSFSVWQQKLQKLLFSNFFANFLHFFEISKNL